MPEDLAVLNNELELLADLARHEIEASWDGSVGPYTPEARAAYEQLTVRLLAAGYDRVIAEWATTIWVLACGNYHYRVLECVDQAWELAELGIIQPGSKP